ncbi:MAG: decaprenyl-phosphate phosphoribosyltransferase [Acidimicrobiales bacterium]
MKEYIKTTHGPDSKSSPPPQDRRDNDTKAPMRHKRHVLIALFLACRPRQWLKNLLVLAAPAAAGGIFRSHELFPALAAAGFFTLASSGIYLINDVIDREADRAHPTKCRRPIASGDLGVKTAVGVAIVLTALALLLPLLFYRYQVALIIGIYILVTLAYNFGFKQEAVLDIAAVAVGFLLRAIAGGVADNLPLSDWFLIVAAFGSLFMVAGKRYSELVSLGEEAGRHRRALETYTTGYLNFIRSISAAVAITGYCIWAFDKASHSHGGAIWLQLSIAPFIMGILKYSLVVEEGRAGAPEEVVLGDKVLIALGLLWALCLGVGIQIYH